MQKCPPIDHSLSTIETRQIIMVMDLIEWPSPYLSLILLYPLNGELNGVQSHLIKISLTQLQEASQRMFN